jgi:hypothetical protein
MRNEDYQRACDKLEASSKLVDGVGILFNLAECQVHIGERQRARELYLEVAERLDEAGEDERRQVALQRAAALAPAEVAPEPAAPETKAAVPTAPKAEPRPPVELPPELRPEDPEDERYRQQAVGWGLVIAGGLASAVGFGVFAAGTSSLAKAEKRCGDMSACDDPDAVALADDAVAQQRAGLPIGIAGATGLVAGFITLAVANDSSDESDASRPAVQVAAGPDGGRLGVRFAW